MANAPGLMGNRFRDQLATRSVGAEQIVTGPEIELGKQSVHRAGVRLELSVGQDVRDINSTLVERVSDEKRPMTVKRLLLRAKSPSSAHAIAALINASTESSPKKSWYSVKSPCISIARARSTACTLATRSARAHIPHTVTRVPPARSSRRKILSSHVLPSSRSKMTR